MNAFSSFSYSRPKLVIWIYSKSMFPSFPLIIHLAVYPIILCRWKWWMLLSANGFWSNMNTLRSNLHWVSGSCQPSNWWCFHCEGCKPSGLTQQLKSFIFVSKNTSLLWLNVLYQHREIIPINFTRKKNI